ncbi:MAG: glycosyltransferase [Candidatus Methanomethyliaceae archaeon]
MKFVFWISLVAIAYSVGGYLLLLLVLRAGQMLLAGPRNPMRRDTNVLWGQPVKVSVVIPVRNEEPAIAERIDNLLSLDYPREHLEILVGSDGSTDRTVEIVRQYAGALLKVFEFRLHRGRSAVFNDVVPHARGEVLVFTDAKTRFCPQFLRHVVSWFAQDSVGVVTGRLEYLTENNILNFASRMFLKYEMWLRALESNLGLLTIGLSGACVAIRREVFTPLDPVPDLDDSVGLDALRKGYRIVYEPMARAYDQAPRTLAGEIGARARISSQAWMVFKRYGWRFWLAHPRALFGILSHRVVRWLLPVWLLGLFVASLALRKAEVYYNIIFVGQALWYSFVLLAWVAGRGRAGAGVRILSLPAWFLAGVVGLTIGLIRAVAGQAPGKYSSPE